MIAFGRIHAGLVATSYLPLGIKFLSAIPESDGETGKVPGAEGSGFGDRGDLHRYTEQVGLKLHEKLVARRPAVSAKFPQLNA
jgi:hypothetical protein